MRSNELYNEIIKNKGKKKRRLEKICKFIIR